MRFILLLGAGFNFFGAVTLAHSATRALAAAPSRADQALPLAFFSVGTAAVFGSMYLYLFFYPSFVVPFLIFGATLKTWAFLLAWYLYSKQRATRQTFVQFGVGNGVIALLFWIYIANTVDVFV